MSPRTADPSEQGILAAARRAPDLGRLGELVTGCVACPELVATRHTVVVGDVVPVARLLVVGEAPGAQEDETGRPFVGRAGALLDELLTAAGIARQSVSVLNVVKCRPPGNRTPRRPEVSRCTGWLDRQVELLDPEVVLTLGRTALTWALGPAVTIEAARAERHDWRGRSLAASYHPSAALRFGPHGAPRAALAADLVAVGEQLR